MGNIQKRNKLLTHHEYCIQADLNKTWNGIEFGVLAFFDDVDQFPFKYIWSSVCKFISTLWNCKEIKKTMLLNLFLYTKKHIKIRFEGMLISVPFIAVTIFIYILLPELHNLHGNCLMCYLICLGIGYSFTAWIKLDKWNYVAPLLCSSCGYLMYFFLLSAFLWSHVISFNLWQNLR